MKALLKIELSRAFRNKMLLLALLLGCGIAVAHIFIHVLPEGIHWLHEWDRDERFQVETPFYSVFNSALGFEFISLPYTIFIYIFPILAALPFADSFYTDMKSGYIKNVLIRTKKTNYFAAKYIAVFLSAGVVVVIPLILNLLITAALLPSIIPERYSHSFTVGFNQFGGGLYHSNPYAYAALWYILDFVYAGIFAALALTLAYFVSNRFIVLLSPFILYIAISTTAGMMGLNQFTIMYHVMPTQQAHINFPLTLLTMLVLLLPALAVYFVKGRRHEVF